MIHFDIAVFFFLFNSVKLLVVPGLQFLINPVMKRTS